MSFTAIKLVFKMQLQKQTSGFYHSHVIFVTKLKILQVMGID